MKVGIIGGGINGLFISWRLSSLGHKVQLYEAGKVLQQTSSSSSKLLHGGDLPPEAPSFITRVCRFGFHILLRQFEQARRVRSPQISQALGALQRVFGCAEMSAV